MFTVKEKITIIGLVGEHNYKHAELPCQILDGNAVLNPLTIPTLGRNPTARPMMCLLLSQLWPFAYNPTSSM